MCPLTCEHPRAEISATVSLACCWIPTQCLARGRHTCGHGWENQMSESASPCPVVAEPLPRGPERSPDEKCLERRRKDSRDNGRRAPRRLSGSLPGGQALAFGMEAAWWWGVGVGGKGGWPPSWTVEPLTGSEQLLRGLMCLPSGSQASQAVPGSIAGKGLPAGPVRESSPSQRLGDLSDPGERCFVTRVSGSQDRLRCSPES